MEMKNFLRLFALVLVVVLIASLTTPAYTSNEGKMRVWVEFAPGHGQNVEKALNGIGAEFHYRFENLNSFVVTVPEQALNGLRHNPNVVSIEEDVLRYAASDTYPYGIDMVQATAVWDADGDGEIDAGAPTGSNRTVCIIDSGLFTGHEDFADVHVIGGYPEDWNRDRHGHGTHVAGTIVASLNDVGVVGVSPGDLSLYIVKVFGDDGLWAYSSTLADAANRCGEAGANVISMSLSGSSSNRKEQRAFDDLYNQGVLSVAAAGNDGNDAVHYPCGYDSVMCVAAIDDEMNIADFSQYHEYVEVAAPGVGVLSTVPYLETSYVETATINVDGMNVEFAPWGEVTAPLGDGGICNTETSDLTGQIALCQRGDISFYDKVVNAMGRGAVGVIIYNNVADDPPTFTLGEEIADCVPVIGLYKADGDVLAADHVGETATIHTSIAYDISAYEAWGGTSMATPHVSGVAALVWSANPSWTNAEIRDALDTTALDLGDPGRDVYYGFGLVQAKDALDYLEGNQPPQGDQMYAAVTTDKATYADRETAQITVDVWDEFDAAVANADVTVTITSPKGITTTMNGYTDADGVVSFSYRIKARRNGTGTYEIGVMVQKDGYSNANASTTFVVE